jgi:hypothetical protein
MKRLWKVWEAKSMQLAFKLGEILAFILLGKNQSRKESLEPMLRWTLWSQRFDQRSSLK